MSCDRSRNRSLLLLSAVPTPTGSAFNVIPERAELKGTLRTFDPDTREKMQGLLRQTATTAAAAFGAEADVDLHVGFPSTINSSEEAAGGRPHFPSLASPRVITRPTTSTRGFAHGRRCSAAPGRAPEHDATWNDRSVVFVCPCHTLGWFRLPCATSPPSSLE